jgi:hypothetical protein
MEPIGLTIKRDGQELMVVHKCTGCGAVVKNRIAGVDNHASIEDLLKRSSRIESVTVGELRVSGIELCNDAGLVAERLSGRRE